MFQFPGFASPTYGFSGRYRRSGGLPHSEIHGSKPARGSPWLIATCCVLHRLSVPRHPPDALQTLDLTNVYECATRRRKPTRNQHQPAPHPAKMHHMTQPTASPLPRRRPCRVILGHLFSSHVKDPIPACRRISAFSLADIPSLLLPRSSEGHCPSLCPPPGGGGRDRTDDLMLAKHALSQLSYAPMGKRSGGCEWWAREDLNFRPHAYQARALTN